MLKSVMVVLIVVLLAVCKIYAVVQIKNLNNRLEAANEQITELARCQGEGKFCSWSVK